MTVLSRSCENVHIFTCVVRRLKKRDPYAICCIWVQGECGYVKLQQQLNTRTPPLVVRYTIIYKGRRKCVVTILRKKLRKIYCFSLLIGNVAVKVMRPLSYPTEISPPCDLQIICAIDSPRPLPALLLLRD